MFEKHLDKIVEFLGVAFLGVFGWAFQLGGRVSVLESQRDDLKELINTRFDAVDDRLDRIEENYAQN